MKNRWGLSCLTVLTLVTVFGCNPKKDCYPCEDPHGNETTCWGKKIVFDSGEMQEFAPDDSNIAVQYPPAFNVQFDGTYVQVSYETTTEPRRDFTLELQLDAAASAALTTAKNDGYRWAVLAPDTRKERAFIAWRDQVPGNVTQVDGVLTLASYWNPITLTTSSFDPFTVSTYGQRDATVGYESIDQDTTCWGESLGADVVLPVFRIPHVAFDMDPVGRKTSLQSLVDQATSAAEARNFQTAIDILEDQVKTRMDGSVGGNPSDDWIVGGNEQGTVLPFVDAYISWLQQVAAL